MYTKDYWQQALERHQDYLAGLEEGWLGTFDLANPGITIAEAIEVEKRNIAFCERQLQEAQ